MTPFLKRLELRAARNARAASVIILSALPFLLAATAARAQTSPYYLTDADDQVIFTFRHGAVVRSWTANGTQEDPIAITSGTIRTTTVLSVGCGSQYLPLGTLTGTTYTHALT